MNQSIDAATRAGEASGPDDESSVAPKTGRALVVVSPVAMGDPQFTRRHNHVPFIAQLIATAAGLAQTRVRRRARPTEATRSYAAVGAHAPRRASGRRMSRAI